ncbi:beta-ketoacyl synthase N-terminal-like domain-containing protein [Mesonia mobilis]|uniref:beta-ketoacyl synthase N-terminal-like domain-containing protein n=1 Tax=Mesonia mobilis TaxID=369791 RepID=UPI0034E8F8C6
MLKDRLFITSFASISALGNSSEQVWQNYLHQKHFFNTENYLDESTYVSRLDQESKNLIESLKNEQSRYQDLDLSVLYAILSARETFRKSKTETKDFGINIGSSRGATFLFEKYHDQYLKEGKTSTLASPTTTLGNISSWVLQDLESEGPEISHSITCSTALHGLLNATAWLQSDMAEAFLIGGSEAPLTPFTIAQMKAVKLYANFDEKEKWPNRSLEIDKPRNTMILGEAASTFFVEKNADRALAEILGLGYASEKLTHNISLSKDAVCIQKSMQMALKQAKLDHVDAVVTHAPGTRKGDWAELNAIKAVFGDRLPLITSNKFKIGHTFGASGGMSLEMALLMLAHHQFIENPFFKNKAEKPKTLKTIMVNAVGFGGNAVSVIVGK